MSEISETEIKSMSKEQNYMRGYEDGKSDVLDKMRDEIDKELLSYSKDVEDMGDSARKIRISLGIVRKIIDKNRNEVTDEK